MTILDYEQKVAALRAELMDSMRSEELETSYDPTMVQGLMREREELEKRVEIILNDERDLQKRVEALSVEKVELKATVLQLEEEVSTFEYVKSEMTKVAHIRNNWIDAAVENMSWMKTYPALRLVVGDDLHTIGLQRVRVLLERRRFLIEKANKMIQRAYEIIVHDRHPDPDALRQEWIKLDGEWKEEVNWDALSGGMGVDLSPASPPANPVLRSLVNENPVKPCSLEEIAKQPDGSVGIIYQSDAKACCEWMSNARDEIANLKKQAALDTGNIERMQKAGAEAEVEINTLKYSNEEHLKTAETWRAAAAERDALRSELQSVHGMLQSANQQIEMKDKALMAKDAEMSRMSKRIWTLTENRTQA